MRPVSHWKAIFRCRTCLAPRPDWLGVSFVEWTDTNQAVPVADALPDAPLVGLAFRFTVPAGMTRKVWLTVDRSRLAAGTYHGTVNVGV